MPGQERYFATVCYPEHMSVSFDKNSGILTEEDRLEIRDAVSDIQLQCAYAIHDKDVVTQRDIRDFKRKNPSAAPEEYPVLGEPKPIHVQLMFCFGNTTTFKSAQSAVNMCALQGHENLINNGYIIAVKSVSGYYNYLIHDRDQDREDGKYQYDPSERICLNGFDVESYLSENITVGDGEKIRTLRDVGQLIRDKHFTHVDEVYEYITNPDNGYSDKFQKVCFDKIQNVGQFCLSEYHRLCRDGDEDDCHDWREEMYHNDVARFNDFAKQDNRLLLLEQIEQDERKHMSKTQRYLKDTGTKGGDF